MCVISYFFYYIMYGLYAFCNSYKINWYVSCLFRANNCTMVVSSLLEFVPEEFGLPPYDDWFHTLLLYILPIYYYIMYNFSTVF